MQQGVKTVSYVGDTSTQAEVDRLTKIVIARMKAREKENSGK